MDNATNAMQPETIPTSDQALRIFNNKEESTDELQLVKQENFGTVQCDFYQSGNNEICMTINQLAVALEYNDRKGIEKILERNQYLNTPEYSTTDRLSAVEGNRTVRREMRIFTEDGIYEVTMLSGQPKAREFRAWFRQVLKDIRKYGLYATDELLNNPDLAIRAFETIKKEREKNKLLETEKQALEHQIETDKPKINFANSLLDTNTCIPALDLSKILYQNGVDIGQHRLYTWLRENGYFIKKGDSKNLPTHKAMKLGLFKISEKAWFNKSTQRTEISRKTLVTPKGQMYFINKFISGKIQK